MHVFVAGGSGVLGTRLVRQLVERGHRVTATTTGPARRELLTGLGALGLVVNGLDGAAVGEAVAAAEPDVVVHQMTALSSGLDLRRFDRSFALTNRLRTEGLDHLVAAARAAGVSHVVAQSYTGWPNARSGGWVKDETDPLDPDPPAGQRETLAAIRHVEETVGGIGGTVLRYGGFYGDASDAIVAAVRRRRFPLVGGGTGYLSWVHLDDAAAATVLAIEGGARGLFNIVDDEPAPASQWLPYLAECLGARPPMRLPAWLARLAAGEVAVTMMTQARGSSNGRARRELGWEPSWPTWREGFRRGLATVTAA